MFTHTWEKLDKKLLSIIGLLCVFGLVMMFSSSIYFSEKHFAHPYYFLQRQLIYLCIALALGFVLLNTPIAFLKQYSRILFILNLILLILVFMPVIGGKIKGAYRWLQLGLFNFQPSELMKLTIILYMSGFVIRQQNHIQYSNWGIIKSVLILSSVGLLLLLETDIGAFVIISATALSLLFIAGVELKRFALVILGGLIIVAIVIYSISERWARMIVFLNPWQDPLGKGYQVIQSLIGIGRGEWFGTGLGSGIQKTTFLPDAHTDFIFSVIGEELGVAGMLAVLCLFFYVVCKSFIISKIAEKQGNLYSAFVAYGIGIWLTLQVSINLGVNLGLLPTKGLTLPLFSYGGSSIIISIISLAIVLRIDIENKTLKP